jgi:mannose-1-phosphate guanylyltransferase
MITYLRGHGIDEIILTLGYLPDPIQSYFDDGSGYGIRLTYAVEDSPLGTAGAVKNVTGYINDSFYVFNGDVFTDIDLTEMLRLHRRSGAKATIALTPVEDPTVYGVVETAGGGMVQRFIEKPKREEVTTNMINAGIYILEPWVLDMIPNGVKFMFEQGVFPVMLEQGESIYGYKSNPYWIDIGTPDKYKMLHNDLLSSKVEIDFPGDEIGDGVWVDNGGAISPGVEMESPVVIGRNCLINSGARIKGPTVIDSDCSIGSGSIVDAAIIWRNTSVGRNASVRGCIIAENVSIGDHAQITEGCVLGHGVVIGNGESLEQGTKVWPK